MAEFKMEIAGFTGAVTSLFESTPSYFRPYLTDKEPDFAISVTREDLKFEDQQLLEEALAEGFKIRKFTDPFLERAAIQRAFAEFLFRRDILLLHGSTVAVDGKAYLFTARSGTGKSTHTRLWREAFGSRAAMVNDDKPFLAIGPQILACGSPWSGKHGLDSNISLPLQGICILERGCENRIFPIPAEDAMEMLLHQSYHPLDSAGESRLTDLVRQLAERTPLWKMYCTKDPAAAQIAYDAMSE